MADSFAPIAVRNPRTGQADYRFTPTDPDRVAAVTAALRRAQPAWAHRGVADRVAVLQAWKARLIEARDDLRQALLADTGRWRETVLEVDAVPRLIDRWCAEAPSLLQTPPARPSRVVPFIGVDTILDPYPLVGVISPWNFPLLLSLIDTVPALLAGCAAAVKPSEVTPRFIEPLAATIAAVPDLAAVLAVLPGAGPTGAALIGHVDAICFTGSVATGRKVGEAAAKAFIPAFLELGGKDPAIVTASADVERAAAACLSGSISNAGQACQSLERIYVDRRVYPAFLEALVEKAGRIRLAWPDPTEGEIGPIIFDRQAEIIADHIADAVAKGARCLTGGKVERHGGGAWIAPTVMVDVTHEMTVMREETFGPLLPVMPFDTEEEAARLANDSAYGLSAAVFAGTEAEARAMAARLQAGAVSINDAALTAMVYDAEKNSYKLSGLGGSRMGASGLTRFLRRKALLINGAATPSPWWIAGPA